MNKHGTSFGQIILWLFLFVVGSLIVSAILNPSTMTSIKNNVASIQPALASSNAKICPSNIIPERFAVSVSAGINSPPLVIPGSITVNYYTSWEDGTAIEIDASRYHGDSLLARECHSGSSEGENVNYVYCDNLLYNNNPVSSDGTIGEKISYRISLVLDSKDTNWNGINANMKIVSASCEKM